MLPIPALSVLRGLGEIPAKKIIHDSLQIFNYSCKRFWGPCWFQNWKIFMSVCLAPLLGTATKATIFIFFFNNLSLACLSNGVIPVIKWITRNRFFWGHKTWRAKLLKMHWVFHSFIRNCKNKTIENNQSPFQRSSNNLVQIICHRSIKYIEWFHFFKSLI